MKQEANRALAEFCKALATVNNPRKEGVPLVVAATSSTVNTSTDQATQEVATLKVRMSEQEILLSDKIIEINGINEKISAEEASRIAKDAELDIEDASQVSRMNSHVSGTSEKHPAGSITFAPAGLTIATGGDVQGVIPQLEAKIIANENEVEAGFLARDSRMQSHVTGIAEKHDASSVTYSGSFINKSSVKDALDQAKAEIDTIVISASIDPEVAFAEISSSKSKTFPTLGDRLEELEEDLSGYRLYTTFSSLGLVNTTATPLGVIDAMPSKSICYISTSDTELGFAGNPNQWGILHVIKVSALRSTAFFYQHQTDKTWTATRYKYGETDIFTPWKLVGRVNHTMKERNSEKAVREFMAVAESFKNLSWLYDTAVTQYYGTVNERWRDFDPATGLGTGKYITDCEAFVRAVISGIEFDRSIYVNESNPTTLPNVYDWNLKPGGRLSQDIGEWCYVNGWEIEAGDNYENIQPGDLVFWAINPALQYSLIADTVTEWRYRQNVFRKISHVGICKGIDPVTGKQMTIEVSQSQPIVVDRILNEPAIAPTDPDAGLTSRTEDLICMFARLPLLDKQSRHTLASFYAYYDKLKSIEIIGNGYTVDFAIHNKNVFASNEITINALHGTTGADVVSTTRVSTGFVPMNNSKAVSFGTFLDNNISLVGTWYYTKDKAFISTVSTDATVDGFLRKLYKYGDGTIDITPEVLATIQNTLMYRLEYPYNQFNYPDIVMGGIDTVSGADIVNIARMRTGFVSYHNRNLFPTFSDNQILLAATYYYDASKVFIGTSSATAAVDGFIRRTYKYGAEGTTTATLTMLQELRNKLCNVGSFENGLVSRVQISSSLLPTGTSLVKRNGSYHFFNGTTYTYVGDTLNSSLVGLCVYDGLNYVVNVNGQIVYFDYN